MVLLKSVILAMCLTQIFIVKKLLLFHLGLGCFKKSIKGDNCDGVINQIVVSQDWFSLEFNGKPMVSGRF